MNKIYLVTYNTDINFNRVIFHNYVDSLFKKGHISDWWHYIDTTYLVVTSKTVNELYSLIFPGVPGRYLFIVEIDSNNAQGWLPKNAWAWLQKYQRKS